MTNIYGIIMKNSNTGQILNMTLITDHTSSLDSNDITQLYNNEPIVFVRIQEYKKKNNKIK